MIICPNPSCQTPNPLQNAHCSHCRAAIPHRYLWAVGAGNLTHRTEDGELTRSLGEWPWSERYQYQHSHIFLDTQPGKPPEAEPDFPDFVLPYLYLSGYRLQVPRPYALLPYDETPLLLLEDAALTVESRKALPTLLPSLSEAWTGAPPLRQLHWLWQILQLWPALETEQVGSSLLTPELLRVDGSIVQLLELTLDRPDRPPTLKDLGQNWQPLAESAHEAVRDFLLAICSGLKAKKFTTIERLVTCLDQALTLIGAGQKINCELAVFSDQGPTRQRNEDSCYPASGVSERSSLGPGTPSGQPLMLVVCDGIGGHQGGDVASKLAIATVQHQLKPILNRPDLDSVTVTLAIEKAICAANDEISQQNDHEDRFARDRMGTTLVMALVLGPHLYIANIGDSRAYRINPHSCHQVTLDDDVASREVRLGYGFYREVVDHPGAGALVQALGMHNSQTLYPNVQRFTLDEDNLFLLCSDGLSDGDRVEQFWQTELLPILKGKQTVAASGKNLIQIANTYNGHDNVTVGVLHCRVSQSQAQPVPISVADPNQLPRYTTQTELIPSLSSAKTVLAKPATLQKTPQKTSVLPLMVGILGLGGIGFALGSFFFMGSTPSTVLAPFPEPTTTPNPLTTSPTPAAVPLTPGSYAILQPTATDDRLTIKATPSLDNEALNEALNATPNSTAVNSTPGDSSPPDSNPPDSATNSSTNSSTTVPAATAQLAAGTVVQVLGKQESADQARWVQLKVCTRGAGNTEANGSDNEPVKVGNPPPELTTGWVLESQLAPIAQAVEPGFVPPVGNCQ